MPNDDTDEVLEPEEFEELVAALLKVDPEGITGQRSKKAQEAKDADNQQ
jgi:hypothetical protein